MAHKTNSFERFWKELKRRKVVHVITVYAAIAFVILQLTNMVVQPLRLPDWTEAFVIFLLCIGFVIAVFVSWVYDITPAGVRKTKPAREISHIDQTKHQVSSGWKIATYTSILILVALVAFNFISKRSLNSDISKLEKSIAVLPFLNESPSDSNKYFINGIMEEVLNNLQKIKEFRVLSRTSTVQFAVNDRPVATEIGNKLGVSYLVEGSGQKYGDKFRLRVQLIQASGKEAHLWANSYEVELKGTSDLFSIQSQIARAIATELKATITPEEIQLIEKPPANNLASYDLYLKAYDYSLEYTTHYDLDSYKKALTLLKASLEIDSSYARAYSGLAVLYAVRYPLSGFLRNYLDSSLLLANKALSIDDQLDDAYIAKGGYYSAKGKKDEALEYLDKALKINPNSFNAYFQKGNTLTLGSDSPDFIRGFESYQKALNLAQGGLPPSLLRMLTNAYANIGCFEEAEKYILEELTISGDSSAYFGNLAFLEASKGNFDNAASYSDKALKDPVGFVRSIWYFSLARQDQKAYIVAKNLADNMDYIKKSGSIPYNFMQRIGYAFWKAGRYKEADFYLNEQIRYAMEGINQGSFYSSSKWANYDLAGVYAFKGDNEKAYKYLDEFNTMNFYPAWLIVNTRNDPLFASIRNEERFQKILQNMEAKYQAEHERVRKWLEEQGML